VKPTLTRLLTIDSVGGLVAGVIVLVFSAWLSEVHALPRHLLLAIGVANLTYGSYSGLLARKALRSDALLVALILANATWAIVCFVAAVLLVESASPFGLVHLIGEGLVVGTLAGLEWRGRAQ